MARALLVKNYQIKLLKKVCYILLVLCTWFDSFSNQLEAHQDSYNINVWKRTETEVGAGAVKNESSGAGAGAMFMKRRAPEPELRHFYNGSAALLVTGLKNLFVL